MLKYARISRERYDRYHRKNTENVTLTERLLYTRGEHADVAVDETKHGVNQGGVRVVSGLTILHASLRSRARRQRVLNKHVESWFEARRVPGRSDDKIVVCDNERSGYHLAWKRNVND